MSVKTWPRPVNFALGLLMIAGVWAMDRDISPQVSMAILYLVPVGFVAWSCGGAWGYAASLLSAAAWLQVDIAVDHRYTYWLIPYWNALMRLGFFALVAALAGIISRLRELVDRERELSRLKSDMVSLVSHEFGNFLTTFKLSLSLLEDSERGAPPASRARAYATLNRVYLHLTSAVQNFLNLNRIEAGRFVAHLRRTRLRTLLHGIVAQLGPVVDDKRIKLRVEFPPHPVPVKADPDAVAVVVSNLLTNAFKYTSEGGEVTLSLTLEADAPPRARVSVEDTGIGISAEDLEKIMAGFYRAESGRRASAKGFGVGLMVARDLLKTQGSRLEVASEPGRGSTFSFTLPLWRESEGDAAKEANARGLVRAGS